MTAECSGFLSTATPMIKYGIETSVKVTAYQEDEFHR